MNKTSRTDEPLEGDGLNQSPSPFSADLTTNNDFNGLTNARQLRDQDPRTIGSSSQALQDPLPDDDDASGGRQAPDRLAIGSPPVGQSPLLEAPLAATATASDGGGGIHSTEKNRKPVFSRIVQTLVSFGRFVGPGFMISVAYIDPGNYSTDIAAGASYRFKLLFIVLLSNLFAIVLQSLAIKLGTVTGLDLASACRAFLPRWLNYFLYGMAEIAIIATDIAEVIGTAIALNLLIPKLPLVGGCALSILDVMAILFFYRPDGAMRGLRLFECFVCILVLGVVVCFCIQLSLIANTSVGDVFRGYLPSSSIVQSQGLYQACGILGATVMPHSLFLGSGIVQPRLKEYDIKKGLLPAEPRSAVSSMNEGVDKISYVPSLASIKHSLKYSITETALALFTFALFVNSAILIVAGASLYNNPEALDANIFGIHDLLAKSISPAAGTIFALALLLSGVSAGIVCTIAGQMVSEGALNWRIKPWLRRLVTRSISITPSIIIAGAVGRSGLDAALNGSQVALSIVLPFVTLPLIYFTSRDRYMTVQPGNARFFFFGSSHNASQDSSSGTVKMANGWVLIIISSLIWVVITVMNIANLVLLGLGNT